MLTELWSDESREKYAMRNFNMSALHHKLLMKVEVLAVLN
jgi:hypothetical protein